MRVSKRYIKLFETKFNKGRSTECWNWLKGTFSDGYGQFSHPQYRRAHRFAYIAYVGNIPKTLQVCHHCDNPLCVNPKHLFLGTALDNHLDMMKKGRSNFPGPNIPATGKRNGTHTHSEKVRRGDTHPFRATPEIVPKGEKHGRALLTEEKVRMVIKFKPTKTKTLNQLAKELGVAVVTLEKVRSRVTWKHVIV